MHKGKRIMSTTQLQKIATLTQQMMDRYTPGTGSQCRLHNISQFSYINSIDFEFRHVSLKEDFDFMLGLSDLIQNETAQLPRSIQEGIGFENWLADEWSALVQIRATEYLN